jgi:RNA polymerase sigma-70 factor (ECF subfamily)
MRVMADTKKTMHPASHHRDDFEALYSRNYGRVLSYCARRLPRAEALDAAADVFVIAWRKLSSVPSGPAEKAWLYGTAYRIVSNRWRSAKRRLVLTERVASLQQAASGGADEPVLRRAEEQSVLAALDALPASEREVILLDAWEGLSSIEIAEVLGIKPAAVRKRRERARRRLQKMVAAGPTGLTVVPEGGRAS